MTYQLISGSGPEASKQALTQAICELQANCHVLGGSRGYRLLNPRFFIAFPWRSLDSYFGQTSALRHQISLSACPLHPPKYLLHHSGGPGEKALFWTNGYRHNGVLQAVVLSAPSAQCPKLGLRSLPKRS